MKWLLLWKFLKRNVVLLQRMIVNCGVFIYFRNLYVESSFSRLSSLTYVRNWELNSERNRVLISFRVASLMSIHDRNK